MVYVNTGFNRITGYSQEEIIGKNCRFLQGPDTDQQEVNKIRDSIKNKTGCIVELENYRKDGTKFWNRLSFIPLFDNKSKLTHFVGIQSDITDVKNMLKEKSEFNAMQTTLQTVDDIVFNFMNALQLVKLHLEKDPAINSKIISEFNFSFDKTLNSLKLLNTLEKFKEKEIGCNIRMIDTE